MIPLPDSLAGVLEAINKVYRTVLGLPVQASSVAREIDALHYLQITIYTTIAIAYYAVAFTFLVRYRRRGPYRPTPSIAAPGLVTTYAAGVFGLFAIFWGLGHLEFRTLRTPPADALDVYVTAKQWTWKFAYADGGESAGVLYVPVGQPVRLLLTSRDVIHSFFVPAFRLKQDAVPGTYTTMWFEAIEPGTYDVFCTQMCGVGHSSMAARVAALTAGDFDAWRAASAGVAGSALVPGAAGNGAPDSLPPTSSLAAHGQEVAARLGCLRCHTTDGQRHIGPTWRGLFGSTVPFEDGTSGVADAAYLTESMMDPARRVVRGFPPVMPSYQGLIAPEEAAALVEYIRSIRAPLPPSARTPPPAAPIPAVPAPTAPSPGGAR